METLCKASGTPIISVVMKTPLDHYVSQACGKGVHLVQRLDPKSPMKKSDFSADVLVNDDLLPTKEGAGIENLPPRTNNSKKILQKVTTWFHLYFTDPSSIEKRFPNSISICVPDATEFQVKVWETLRDQVHFGNTVSYGELAALVDKPNAARAVGSTMKRNPNGILVPCHRVIKTTAEIGNYNAVGGRDIKLWLLDHEKKLAGKS